ncbi:Hypothetical predicted protein [Cloeon dipterum]|uniref:Ninjurin-2 n=1 Tax=Cloeon dipterum TaxID=197152 RepID=A0A8S1DMU8_9INSE|nr:Hypothetical predicted protein [Cloeon dipterum]
MAAVVHRTIDANRYASKKTLAQGMLDIALLTANASQLKYILQVGHQHEFYTLMVTLISISIILQILVGVLFVLLGGLNINKERDQRKAEVINDISTALIFVISIVNVIISGFGLETKPILLSNLNREDIIEP